MLTVLGLIGIGIALAAVVGSDSDSGGDDRVTISANDDEPVAFVGSDFLDDFTAGLDDLVAEGEITQDEADLVFANTPTAAGPVTINAAGGEDAIVGTNSDDIIRTGAGADIVYGGGGDDMIDLGDDSDVSGESDRTGTFPDDLRPFLVPSAGLSTPAALEAGDDVIHGGAGDDDIADAYGANELRGEAGNDLIVAIDADGVTPDVVRGGLGADALFVDEGDEVTTGNGRDYVTVDLFAGVENGYQVVTITDFDAGRDTLELEGDDTLLRAPTPQNPGDVPVNPITVTPTADGLGSIVAINGIPVVRVEGVPNLTVGDISIST